jgi:hypothetical protein
VAPCSIAQSFIATATVLAIAGSSGEPSLMVRCSFAKTSLGRRFSIVSPLNVMHPK